MSGSIGQEGDLLYVDFEATGCNNEGTPTKLSVDSGTPNCDSTTNPSSGLEHARFDTVQTVKTASIATQDRFCWELDVDNYDGSGAAGQLPWNLRTSGGAVEYPSLMFASGQKVQVRCDSTPTDSPASSLSINAVYRRVYFDVTKTGRSACVTVGDKSSYQNSDSVCCSGSGTAAVDYFQMGAPGFFSPRHDIDEVRIYNGPCRVSPLFEGSPTAQDNGGSNSTSFALSAPANREVGDLLIAFIGQESASDCTLTPPTGWTQIGSTSSGTPRGTTAAYWNTLDDSTEASTASWTWTSNCSREWVGAMHKIAARTYNDASAGSWLISLPSYVETAEGAGTIACQSVTGLPARAMVARAAFWETSSTSGMTASWSAGTESFDVNSSGGGASNIMVHGIEEMESSGTVGSNTSDLVGANTGDAHCWTIPIKPAA